MKMFMSQVGSKQSERMKKRFYIAQQDEFNCSSEPLNSLVLSAVLSAMPACPSSNKALKHGYLADLVREGGISPCSLLLGLIYIRRLTMTNQEYLATVSSRNLFLIAMVVASKYMNDEGEMEALTNSEWSAIGSTPKQTVDKLERGFLKAIDWRLYVPIQEFYAFVSSAEGRVAMEQASRRGWVTYTDLSAIWENSDLQASMMKHTAKVAFSGVTLYLVCVSTLMAALHSLPVPLLRPESAGPGHQLQQDPLQVSTGLSSDQVVLQSQLLVHATTGLPVTWKEVWPGGGVCPSDLFSAMPRSKMDMTSPMGYNVANHTHPWPGPAFCMPRPPAASSTPPNANSNWLRQLLSIDHTPFLDLKAQGIKFLDTESQNVIANSSGSSHVGKVPSHNSLELCPCSWLSHPSPAGSGLPSHMCQWNPTQSCSLTCSSSGRGRELEPPFKAKVKTLQAEDLGYHHRGTFHWDPLINSSSYHHKSSLAAAFTFIVDYLIPYSSVA